MLLETVRGAFLGWTLASRAVASSSFSSTHNSSYGDMCGDSIALIANGYCDAVNNNAECGYDGGDCCQCSCVSTSGYTCGFDGFDCQDPEAGEPVFNCAVVSIEPPEVYPCSPDTPRQWVVETTADANLLADGLLCSGGTFEVEWKGSVSVQRTLYSIDGTVLDVTGAAHAVADGGGITQLFSAFNASLRVSNVHMTNGAGIHGGAMFAAQKSEVTLVGVAFSSNIADYFGGAVYLENSSLALATSSNFTDNSATFGGAVYLGKSSRFLKYVGSGQEYRFIDNSATDGGAFYVLSRSLVDDIWKYYTTSTSSYVSSSEATYLEDSSSYRSVNGSARNLYGSDKYYPRETPFDADVAATIFVNNSALSSGGAVFVDDGSVLSCAGETRFKANNADLGGALFLGYKSNIHAQGTTTFSLNRARSDGGAIASAVADSGEWTSGIEMNGAMSYWNNTCGRNGGAMALFGTLSLSWGWAEADFVGNSADLFGGAIYASVLIYGVRFFGARFTENKAQNGGAVFASASGTAQYAVSSEIQWTTSPNYFYNCTFVGNTAVASGGAIESAAGRDVVEESTFVGNIASVGGALTLFGTAGLLDSTFSDNLSGEGGGSAISSVGIITEMARLYFSANYLQCPLSDFLGFSEGNSSFEVICRGCDVPCQDCIFEDDTLVPMCATTFAHAQSGGGPTTIEGVMVDRGHWRASNKSTAVLPCYNPAACLGGVTGEPGYCSEGYAGPYCSVCSEGYAATLAFGCSRCSDGHLAMVVVAIAIILLAALAVVWHMVSIQQGTATRGTVVRLETILPLQSLKIIVVAWQIVTQFSSVANVIYPETYQRLLDFAALANFDLGRLLSAGCIMDVDFHGSLLAATVTPLAAIALLGVTYAVAARRNRGSESALRAVRRKHQSALVFVTFFVYSSVSSAVFRAFACDELDDETVYLRADYRIECDSPRHRAFQVYAGLMIAVYPVGIPLFYAIILFHEAKLLAKGRGTHERRSLSESTSTLRKPYRPSVFYYEVVECSRRVLLTGAVVFIYPNTAAQIAVTILIAFVFVIVSEGLRPYVSRWDSWMSRAGHVIVFLSMYVALLLRVDISHEKQRDQNVFAGILVAAHAVMILAVIVETMALVYSLRNKETSLPISRGSSARSFRSAEGSNSLQCQSGI